MVSYSELTAGTPSAKPRRPIPENHAGEDPSHETLGSRSGFQKVRFSDKVSHDLGRYSKDQKP